MGSASFLCIVIRSDITFFSFPLSKDNIWRKQAEFKLLHILCEWNNILMAIMVVFVNSFGSYSLKKSGNFYILTSGLSSSILMPQNDS